MSTPAEVCFSFKKQRQSENWPITNLHQPSNQKSLSVAGK